MKTRLLRSIVPVLMILVLAQCNNPWMKGRVDHLFDDGIPSDPGNGTSTNPFKVYSRTTLQKIGSGIEGWGLSEHYIMTANINMSGTNFTSIGSSSSRFDGTFNGNRKTISNLTISVSSSGLFGYIDTGGVVQKLTLSGVNITTPVSNFGSVAGYNDGTVEECYVSGTIAAGMQIGGVVGVNSGIVKNCSFSGTFSGTTSAIGGVVGNNFGTVSNCYSTGTVTGGISNMQVGGVVGLNNATIQNCYSSSNVIITSGVAVVNGGIVGGNSGTVSNCYSTGNITGLRATGGITGSGSVNNCVALNPSITRDSGTEPEFGRVTGMGGPLTNNYALSSMVFIDGAAPPTNTFPGWDNSLNGKDGLGISPVGGESSMIWWRDTANWTIAPNKSGASDTSPWYWGAGNRPRLWFE